MIKYYTADAVSCMACVLDTVDFLDYCRELDYNSIEEMPQAIESYKIGKEILDVMRQIAENDEQIQCLINNVLDNNVGIFVDVDRKLCAIDLFRTL
jgi:hypothetical protein